MRNSSCIHTIRFLVRDAELAEDFVVIRVS